MRLKNKELYLRLVNVAFDVLFANFAVLCALFLFYGMKVSETPFTYVYNLKWYLPVYTVVSISVFYCFRLYHSIKKYVSLTEAVLSALSCIVITAFFWVLTALLAIELPAAVYFLSFFILLSMTLLSRFAYRLLHILSANYSHLNGIRKSYNIMIIGAGKAGNMLIREMKNSNERYKKIVCVIDDDPDKIGKYIQGVKIVGNRDYILKAVEKYSVKEIIYTIPYSVPNVRAEILNICKRTGCLLKTIPNLMEQITDDLSLQQVRQVNIEDLLGRAPICIDLDSIMGYIRGKVVMVTGGGGSIGSELCRQLAKHKPKQLIIFDIYENNAYELQMELSRKYPELNLVTLIGSVRDVNRVDSVFKTYRPEIVYHAAAHKHVPLMESSSNEAIKNNVFGTLHVAQAADRYRAEKFILISTDKAVNPTNIMGASKRICEMIVQSFSKHSNTIFSSVRFGNVLGSNGSVIPLFKKQIEEGGPVCVTHPDMMRYFMTISEAVSLVLQAGTYARGGEIFILDMGEPVSILELAENLIRLSGYEPYKDINIKFTGLRPGEKLYEELLLNQEVATKTANDQIFIGKPLDYDEEKFFSDLEILNTAISSEASDIKSIIKQIVPSYQPVQKLPAIGSDKKHIPVKA